MRHGLKIAFTGAGGTGKTDTLLRLHGASAVFAPGESRQIISSNLSKVPVIKSASRSIYEEQNLTEDKVIELGDKERWKLQKEIFERKIHLDDTNRTFIADRTLLDHWSYCLLYCNTIMSEDEYFAYESLVRKHMSATYTYLFYFPWGDWRADGDGVRQTMSAWQSTVDAIILGYILKWNLPAVAVPQTEGPIKRAEFISDYVLSKEEKING